VNPGQPQPVKVYAGEGITVYYEARRCIHFAACVRGLPEVFRPGERPWIQLGNADATTVAAVVRECPTGALHYQQAGAPDEQPDSPTMVDPRLNGPLFLRGDLEIDTPQGKGKDTRAALCRCGQSSNKPFCDGTHRAVGWQSG
jgi:uncharacterized Fe-S cluster protein YjdI/CDGSH-type Zn-finger protein